MILVPLFTPSKECFLSFTAGNFGKVYLGNNHACNIEGLGVVRVAMENGQEVRLNQIRYVPRDLEELVVCGTAWHTRLLYKLHKWSLEDCMWSKTNCSRMQEGYIVLPLRLNSSWSIYCSCGCRKWSRLWHKILGHMSQKGLDILLSSQKLVIKSNKREFFAMITFIENK